MEKNDNAVVLETTKDFKVPVEKLYKAWNSGEQLKQWWHPFDKNLTNVKNELHTGGSVQYDFDGEQKCHVTGEYQEVIENKKLVYSWNWDLEHDDMKNGDYTLTIDFEPGEDGSRLKIRQEGFTDEHATEPHKQGWDRGLEALRTYLEDDNNDDQPKTEAQAGNADAGKKQPAQTDNQRQPVAQAGENLAEKQNENEVKPGSGATDQAKNSDHADSAPKDETSMKADAAPKAENATMGEASPRSEKQGSTDDQAAITTPKAEQPKEKAEGQPEAKTDQPSAGKGPKPIGPNQEKWDNPEASDEVKKKIDEQKARQNKLQENPNAQDPALAELNKKQDIESRNESPAQDKKSENSTQEDFNPEKNKNEAPAH